MECENSTLTEADDHDAACRYSIDSAAFFDQRANGRRGRDHPRNLLSFFSLCEGPPHTSRGSGAWMRRVRQQEDGLRTDRTPVVNERLKVCAYHSVSMQDND